MVNVFDIEVQARPDVFKQKEQENSVLQEKEEIEKNETIYDRTSFMTTFSTDAYLEDFYTKVEDPAMQMVLKFLPLIACRIGSIDRLLDFGAGPTIHVAATFRDYAKELHLADYLPQNREELIAWKENRSRFDWSTPLKMILTQEGSAWEQLQEMITRTRNKVHGIYHCDCFQNPSVDCPSHLHGTFDVIVTIFCVEYCCNSYEEYKNAIKNIAGQIKSGGHFIMGGILEETWCSFGGRKFTCLYITKEMMLEALKEAGLELLENDKTCNFYEINGMFMICARRI
ncbi:hypothetical protein WR25_18159 isoform B [Diploscapter pachys]|uniref:NNMT/PNMT/TEMT family protein n=1 Tax=Diploscapter pachys TaxID=2018661 RepID=A0A2A2KZ68_9BILA|nr:hypothetical protein WR25_18159 isoform B [Diploscapter pachys]